MLKQRLEPHPIASGCLLGKAFLGRQYAGAPDASMLDRLALPTLYPRDLGERLEMPFDLRWIRAFRRPGGVAQLVRARES